MSDGFRTAWLLLTMQRIQDYDYDYATERSSAVIWRLRGVVALFTSARMAWHGMAWHGVHPSHHSRSERD